MEQGHTGRFAGGQPRGGQSSGGDQVRAESYRSGQGRAAQATGAAPPEPGAAQAVTTPVQDPEPAPTTAPRPPAEDLQTERGLRGLVGSGSSQVSPGAALRARDAARPTDADVAAAERDLIIIRRNWVPRESLPGRP